MPSIAQLLILLALFVLVVLPVILVLTSKRASGGVKFGWFVAAVLFSWLGYIGFMIATKDKAVSDNSSNH